MHIRNKSVGFTLIELLTVVAVIGILTAIAWPSYTSYTKAVRLEEAQNALLRNSQTLSRYYSQNFSYKTNSTTWVSLPITHTEHFCIRFQGNARGTNSNDSYTLKAVAFDKNKEPRVIRINQDQTMFVCQSSSSSCDESGDIFSGGSSVDKGCKALGAH